jgi:hypothetical protein
VKPSVPANRVKEIRSLSHTCAPTCSFESDPDRFAASRANSRSAKSRIDADALSITFKALSDRVCSAAESNPLIFLRRKTRGVVAYLAYANSLFRVLDQVKALENNENLAGDRIRKHAIAGVIVCRAPEKRFI